MHFFFKEVNIQTNNISCSIGLLKYKKYQTKSFIRIGIDTYFMSFENFDLK